MLTSPLVTRGIFSQTDIGIPLDDRLLLVLDYSWARSPVGTDNVAVRSAGLFDQVNLIALADTDKEDVTRYWSARQEMQLAVSQTQFGALVSAGLQFCVAEAYRLSGQRRLEQLANQTPQPLDGFVLGLSALGTSYPPLVNRASREAMVLHEDAPSWYTRYLPDHALRTPTLTIISGGRAA